MQTIQLHSNDLVQEIDDQTVLDVLALHKKGIIPHLAVIAVGKTAKSVFIRLKKKRAKTLGLELSVYSLPDKTTVAEIEKVIDFLNKDSEVHGIIIQLPLPKKLQAKQEDIIGKIAASKDVDALGAGQSVVKSKDLEDMEARAVKKGAFLPTTAHAMLKLATEHDIDLHQPITLIGRGKLVGQPLAAMLTALGSKPTVVDKSSPDLNKAIFAAKLIMAGTNAPKPFLSDSFVQEGAIVLAAGNEIDHRALEGYAGGITPEKGGVGPLTISLLLSNTVQACTNQIS